MDLKTTDYFKISPLPNSDGKWIVEWPGLGDLHTIQMKWKLLSLLFDTLKLYDVGIGYNLSQYKQNNREWAIQWISCDVWHSTPDEQRKLSLMNLLFTNQQRYEGNTINGVVVYTLDAAEALVYEFEKLVTLFLLKENYAAR